MCMLSLSVVSKTRKCTMGYDRSWTYSINQFGTPLLVL